MLRWAGRADPALAATLGADVPFCLRGGRALVTGIGERLEPLAYRDRRFVLLLPPFGVDTAAVYRRWDELAARGALPRAGDGAATSWRPPPWTSSPRLAAWRELLARATGVEPRLAGSGSTWFVEGDAASLGLQGRRTLTLGREEARLVPVRTVPAAEA